MQPSSPLIARLRAPLIVRRPRVMSALYFGVAGGTAAALFMGVLRLFSSQGPDLRFDIVFGLVCSGAAAVSGASAGARILSDDQITSQKVFPIAANTVAWSHFWLSVVAASIAAVLAISEGNIIGALGSIVSGLLFWVLSVVIAGLVTFPMGYAAGWLLYKQRVRGMRSIGCSLHGTRIEVQDADHR